MDSYNDGIDDEKAVSPVIATILMVAVTVVLAGVLYVWSNELASNQTDLGSMNSFRAEDAAGVISPESSDTLLRLKFQTAKDELSWAYTSINVQRGDVSFGCSINDDYDYEEDYLQEIEQIEQDAMVTAILDITGQVDAGTLNSAEAIPQISNLIPIGVNSEFEILTDGDNSDWMSTLTSDSDAYDKFETSWSSTDLFLSWIGGQWDTEGDMFIYFDVKAGGSTFTQPWNGEHQLPFDADYAIMVEDSNYFRFKEWDGNGWTDSAGTFDSYIGWGGNPTSEFSIPFTMMGLIENTQLKMLAFSQSEYSNYVWASFPPENPTGPEGGMTFTDYYNFGNDWGSIYSSDILDIIDIIEDAEDGTISMVDAVEQIKALLAPTPSEEEEEPTPTIVIQDSFEEASKKETFGAPVCQIVQSGEDDTKWEAAEVLLIKESNSEICGAYSGGEYTCELSVKVMYKGRMIAGQTSSIQVI